ncbi:hypothetical protein I6B53_00080 [Schaalia sp. 19OD2882]|uniref:cytochrome b5 domain-containing protein n=1 Tax=Schaalia sp. 19OD2882 TaxID=2794089 RepID=UPI001C1EF47F|nr:cytochrome b5 domain-containing protein [Schaalia sp. 19OD2882]QWW19587.1 hypothetical protein I6B53_00080 [Schaalia sp. 19OD2882]
MRMLPWIIGGTLALVAVAAVAILLLSNASPNVGDRTKLHRTFTAAEQHTLDTVTVSRAELSAATCGDALHCWIAVDGKVYDVSGVPSWVRGKHHGVKPGADVTESFVKSHHGITYLQKLPVVGSLE